MMKLQSLSAMFNYIEFIQSRLNKAQLEMLNQYIQMILHWNKTTNITSKHNTKARIYDFVCEGIAMSELLNKQNIICDVGSGGGFPGIVLSILNFDHLRLIEVNSKKSAFLQYVVAELGLKAKVYCQKVESLSMHDVNWIVSKAVTSIEMLFQMCSGIMNENTKFLLCKNSSSTGKIQAITLQDRFQVKKTYNFLISDVQ